MTYGSDAECSQAESLFGTGRYVLLSADRMKAAGVSTGDTVTLSADGQSYAYTVLGSFQVRSTNTDAILSESSGGAAWRCTNPWAWITRSRRA